VNDLEHRLLTIVAEGEKVTSVNVIAALRISSKEFDRHARSLNERDCCARPFPSEGLAFPALGWWEVTPRGRQVLADAEPPLI